MLACILPSLAIFSLICWENGPASYKDSFMPCITVCLYICACVRPSVRPSHIFWNCEPLPNCPRLSCRASGLVFNLFALFVLIRSCCGNDRVRLKGIFQMVNASFGLKKSIFRAIQLIGINFSPSPTIMMITSQINSICWLILIFIITNDYYDSISS